MDDEKFWGQVQEICGEDAWKSRHHLSNKKNFVKTEGRLQIADYGSNRCQEVINKWGDDLFSLFKFD